MTSEPSDFADFRALSASLGEDPMLAQGAGGNTSIKHNGAMWVKVSGAWLKNSVSENIFVPVDRKTMAVLPQTGTARSSIETPLHAALPQRIVVHIHAIAVLSIAVRKDAEKLCAEKLSGLNFSFVPYAKPGDELTKALKAGAQKPCDVFILGNHGLIVAGDNVAHVKAVLADVMARLKAEPRGSALADIKFLEQMAGKNWRLPRNDIVHSLATDKTNCDYAVGGTLYPDHVVFLGRGCKSVPADKIASIDPAKQPMILVEGKGVLLASNLSPTAEAMAEALAEILARIPPGAALRYLSKREEDELLNWDAEKYRRAVT